jgi:tRNA(adenine34) deaminase
MEKALELSYQAEKLGDIPIGAIVVDVDGKIISEAHNERELTKDPSAHAELLAIRRAAEAVGNWRLTGCTVVVTLEPCVMCSGALSLARVDRVVYGASDLRAGAMGSIYSIHEDTRLNHKMIVQAGVLGERCREELRNFFKAKRKAP